jgi:asparagine synthase (glutamine-hydrolysing)
MCGINGHASPLRQPSVLAVEAMNRALQHRGPDDGGVHACSFAAIGMRRLSIVDIAHGAQPMTADNGRYALVYNGEIYDFDRMRAALARRGARFSTRSDTEVLLHALRLDAEGCLPSLNGMFAFAFVDRDERTLLLARDPIGIKPLYYWLSSEGELVFSSEITSLLAHPSVPRTLDRRSLAMLLHDRYIADPWTLLDGVYQLPPGSYLRWRDGRIEVRAYAGVEFAPQPIDENVAREELRSILDETVRSQLVADVPVGVFLSGGIDSSTVAAFAARAKSEPVKSFSVGFSRPEYDESGLARAVAKHLGTEHHEVRIEDARFDEATLDRILDHVGQPLGDTSCIPTYIVSKLAAEHVKVVLSGDGGDEFFGGYDHMFWAARVRRMSQSTPSLVRRFGSAVLAGVAPMAPAMLAEPARRARKGLELTFLDPDAQFRRMRCLWNEDELTQLLGAPVDLRPEYGRDPTALSRLAPEEHAMQTLARTFMPGAILPKVDRMSMAASLEVRVPLLDLRVVRFAERLPLELKVRGRVGKYLLREAGRSLLPPAVYKHKKQGFSIPLRDWFNPRFHELVGDLYAPGSKASTLFERVELDRILACGRRESNDATRQSDTNNATRVWVLAMVGRWMERFGVTA